MISFRSILESSEETINNLWRQCREEAIYTHSISYNLSVLADAYEDLGNPKNDRLILGLRWLSSNNKCPHRDYFAITNWFWFKSISSEARMHDPVNYEWCLLPDSITSSMQSSSEIYSPYGDESLSFPTFCKAVECAALAVPTY